MENDAGLGSRYCRAWIVAAAVLMAIGVAASFAFISLSGNVIVLGMVVCMYGSIHFSVGLAQDRKPSVLIVPALNWSLRAGLAVLAVLAVALHAPVRRETRRMLDAQKLALIPDGGLVVNTARAALIDTDVLLAEVRSGRSAAGRGSSTTSSCC